MRASLYVVLMLHVNVALAGILSSPGLQRIIQGSSCTFQWTVTGTVADFIIHNQTTGTSATLSSRGSSKFDSTSKTITLTIISIALGDAGNYSLSIYNGASWENDSNALLFVFGSGSTSLRQTLGGNPATEGDTVEFTCAFTSSSLPIAYRPHVLYVWYPGRFYPSLQVLSNGSLQITNGDIVSGYGTRNDGKTLTIASVLYNDAQYIRCTAKEEESPSEYSSPSIYFDCQYKPVVLSSTNPPSRKFNAKVGETVQLFIYAKANPALLSSGSNWTFVSSQGIAMDLPQGSVVGQYTRPYLSFTLPSDSYYGNYSYDLTNAVGTTTVTFEVLRPGPPDPPAAFQVAYVTHFSIRLQWNCMWSNYNRGYQYIYTLLREPKSNVTVGAHNNSVAGDCYNSTGTPTFSSAIQPDTQYEASVWSANDFGSSSVTTISVRSAKVFRFVVSSDSIQINGATAIINYRVESGNITFILVTCCYELTGVCVYTSLLPVNNTSGQANLSIGSLPNGTEYVFDFTLYVGKADIYGVVGLVKGIRVSTAIGRTTMPTGNSGSPDSDLAPAVIALAVLLAVAVSVIVGMLLGFFIWKRRHNFPTSQPEEPSRSGTSRSEADDGDHYEAMDRETRESRVYANLDQTKSS